jgi:UTP--glucose-1-phosphate uridylyltransferase
MFGSVPVIKLGDHFKKVGASLELWYFVSLSGVVCDQISEFQSRFKKIPNVIDLDHLTVTGDVHFGRGVTLRGTVIGRHRIFSVLC